MSERRAGAKGRRLGSSRRKQLQEGPGRAAAPAPGPSEEPPWASEIVQRVQHLLSARDTEQAGVVTRSDMQKLQEEGLPCSREELELVFDGLDAAGTGRLGTEEFTAGLRQFLSSQNAAREHRRRRTASRRVRLVLPGPVLEQGPSEDSRHFAAFMEQLGTDNLSEEQEIWQLWVKLRQDEPQLLDNLEGFLAKMRQRIQEARSEKEALELTLNKRVAEHDKDVQQLCEALEQQIQQEQLRLQQQSMARSQQQGEELQRVLDASEREVQRFVTAQMELERRCRSLQSSQQVTSTENQQLQESNWALQQQLQHLHQQLQHTQGHLRTMRATVAWEHMGEPGDRVVAELPIEVPMSPQLSPGKSEKFRSEMRIRLGSQSSESKAKSTHQVAWEMLPAETNLSGAPRKASSAEEDPFPEPLKEEGVSDQSSLLREMNDAIAALSKHLKAQALGAAPALADTACHPWDNAQPKTEPEAATAHETTPGVLQETLPGHIHHELLEGDLQEGPGTAELRAPDVTQAGASAGAGHCTAQEPGAEQGESPEQAQRMLFQQGKGAGVEEMVLKVAEHLGDSTEAGEQVLMEVEGAGWLQGTTAWAKPQLLGEAEEVEISQREDLEAGLRPPEAGQEGVAVGQCLAMDEQQPGRMLGVQAPGTELQERADPASGLPGKLETELGEHLEPQPPPWGEAQVGAAHGGGVPEVTVAPGPAVLDEERARLEVQPQGETMDSKVPEVLPAQAERAGSSRAGGEEEEEEEAKPREAEQQLQGECARGGAGWRGSVGSLEPLAAAVPPTHGKGGGGTDVELMEAPSSTNMELLAEVEADLQVWIEAGSPGTQQGGGVDPGVQLKKDKPEVGLGKEMGAAAVHSEGPSPAETPVSSPDLCGLFPGTSQVLVEADLQLSVDLSPENPQGGKGERAVQLPENEEEDGAQGQVEQGLPHEPVPHPSAVTLGQGQGAGAGLELRENAESLDTTEEQSTGANVQLIAEGDELRLTPAGSTESDLQLMGEAGSSGTEQGGSVDPEVQHLDQGDKAELVEGEAEDAQADLQLAEGLSSGVPWGGEIGTNVKIEEKVDEAPGQGQDELPQEPELDLHRSGFRQGGKADEDMEAQEEAESLDTTEEQSSGANVQLIAEGDELRLSPGGSTEADLQPLGEAGSSGTEQGGSVDPEVQHLDQGDKAELAEGEAEDAQADLQLAEGLSSGVPQGGEIGTNVKIEEKDDEAQGQCEDGLSHEPELDLHGSGVEHGKGAGEDIQAQEKAESLDTIEDQRTGTNVQLIAEGDELKSASGKSTEADLQPFSQTDSMGTEQGGNVAPDAQPLDQGDKAEVVEREAEDSWTDTQLCLTASPETPQGVEQCAAVQPRDGAGDGGQGQGGSGQMQELVPDPSGVTIRQRRGTEAGVQPVEEAESLDTVENQSSGANVQLVAEGDELRLSPGGSTEADLQPLGEAGSSGTEQGGSVDPEVQHLDQGDKAELVEGEAEDAQADLQLAEGLSSGVPQGGEIGTNVKIEEKDDEAQGQGEDELPQEPELDLHRSGFRQGGEADEDMQAQEESESLDTTEEQSTGANVQLIAEGDELRLSPGGSTEADLQPLGEAGSSGTEQRGSVDPEVQHLDQGDKEEFLEGKAEDVQEDMVFHEGPSPGAPWGGEGVRSVQLQEEEHGTPGQGQDQLPQEPELDLQGSGVRQGGEADEDMQAQEEAESLDTTEEQSTGANVQLIAEGDELRLSPGGSTESDLQPLGEAGSSGTEQGGSVDPEVQHLDQGDKAELVEGEAEDAQADLQLAEGLSPGAPWGGEWEKALQNEEDGEGVAEVPGENGLPQESVLAPEGAGGRQGEGAGAGAQPQEKAERLHTLEAQSTDAAVQLFTDQQMPQSGSGGSREADLTPLGVAGLWEGEQGLTPGLEAVLGASSTANPWEGAAAADVPPPTEAALCPEPATAAEDPGLEAKLGACIGPEGQILEAQELLQGERAPAEGKPLDGAHGLEVAQGEKLEAGVRNEVKTQGLGLNQGHDDAELASLVSEVLSQLSPLKLETMMQEDVLIPDVWRLCAPGQAAQRELQEQVSAQGHEGRLHTVAQQPEGETPPTREPEHTAAGPAEHPKQEVPPASLLHTAVQPGDAGSDQLGVVLRENSLGQRQLLGEQSKGISFGQREKMQEFGQKMSQEGEPSSGEPGAVTAGGAGAAPQGCPKAALDPDHLYNVLFVGDSHVGKTSFLYRLHADTFNPHLTATVGLDYQIKTFVVDNKCFALRLWDSAGQERYRSMTKQFFRKADGVVLMYDITSEYSFSDVRYWLSCIQEGAEDGVAVLLLGNKTDCAAQRQVPTKEGECLAKEHQLMFYECSAASGHNVFESMVSFTRLLKVREDELKNKAEEVPKAPQKKKGCCW